MLQSYGTVGMIKMMCNCHYWVPYGWDFKALSYSGPSSFLYGNISCLNNSLWALKDCIICHLTISKLGKVANFATFFQQHLLGDHKSFEPFDLLLFSPRPLMHRWTDDEMMLATGSRVDYLRHHLKISSAYADIPVRDAVPEINHGWWFCFNWRFLWFLSETSQG